MNKAIFKYIT